MKPPKGFKFFECSRDYPSAVELSTFFSGVAPLGGEVVCAKSSFEAMNLFYRYVNGEKFLKSTLYGVIGEKNSLPNIIYE